MFRGNLNPLTARENPIAGKLIHDEIYSIEGQIRTASECNHRYVFIENTVVTNKTIPPFQAISTIDISLNAFLIPNHGFVENDYVEFNTTGIFPSGIIDDTEYRVIVVDVDNIKIYMKGDSSKTEFDVVDIGTGILSIKKVSTAEQFLKAWDEFYIYPDSQSYIYILETIETHFRKTGFKITRQLNSNNKTLRWKIEW